MRFLPNSQLSLFHQYRISVGKKSTVLKGKKDASHRINICTRIHTYIKDICTYRIYEYVNGFNQLEWVAECMHDWLKEWLNGCTNAWMVRWIWMAKIKKWEKRTDWLGSALAMPMFAKCLFAPTECFLLSSHWAYEYTNLICLICMPHSIHHSPFTIYHLPYAICHFDVFAFHSDG